MAIHKNYAPLSLGVTEARTELVKAIEEAKNPSRIVPQATVISLLIVTSLYSLAGASLTYLIPYKCDFPILATYKI